MASATKIRSRKVRVAHGSKIVVRSISDVSSDGTFQYGFVTLNGQSTEVRRGRYQRTWMPV